LTQHLRIGRERLVAVDATEDDVAGFES
jgi:hypothetical protein